MCRRRTSLQFLRFKERKFGRGCLDQWRKEQKLWLKQLEERLLPFEEMLTHQPFLLGDQPRFVDFDLFGMLENFLYSGHYELPARTTNPAMASADGRIKRRRNEISPNRRTTRFVCC